MPKLIGLLNEKYTIDDRDEDDIDELDTEISQYDIKKLENELKNNFFDDLKNFNTQSRPFFLSIALPGAP